MSAEVNVQDWLGGNRSVLISEEVAGLGRYGKTLTILSSETLGREADDEEAHEEENLERSWTPRNPASPFSFIRWYANRDRDFVRVG